MPLTFVKRIADPIHGTIELTATECKVIETRPFQRLRGIKQLGLAHFVFPNADYSRLSHSLGVCHVAGRTLQAIQNKHPKLVTDDQIQDYRLAGLCHDIGHYPYSHAMEHALENCYSESLFAGDGDGDEAGAKSINHEVAGKQVLTHDKELLGIMSAEKWKDIISIFARERPPVFSNLISSDLDADRIDYLMRTAHHTGLPYGNVDIQYLLSQIRVDKGNHICFSDSALRAAEHLLICRSLTTSKSLSIKPSQDSNGSLKKCFRNY